MKPTDILTQLRQVATITLQPPAGQCPLVDCQLDRLLCPECHGCTVVYNPQTIPAPLKEAMETRLEEIKLAMLRIDEIGRRFRAAAEKLDRETPGRIKWDTESEARRAAESAFDDAVVGYANDELTSRELQLYFRDYIRSMEAPAEPSEYDDLMAIFD